MHPLTLSMYSKQRSYHPRVVSTIARPKWGRPANEVACRETGNEYGGYIGRYGYPPLSFTDTIAGYIKGLDSRHLVV